MPAPYDFKTLQRKIAQYCAYQERSEAEVRHKLQTWQTTEADMEELLQWLKTENYLNETRFAQAFSGGKFRTKKWGKKRLVAEMKRKGVPDSHIQQALQQISPSDYKMTLRQLLAKKLERLQQQDRQSQKQKLLHYALQKGYEFELIDEIIKELLQPLTPE